MDLRSSTGLICVVLLLNLCLPTLASFNQFRKIPNEKYQEPQGYNLQLSCITERKDQYCLWLRNGITKLPDSEHGRYQYNQRTNNGDCTLTIRNLTFSTDNASWQCQVPNLELAQYPKTDVVVLVKPNLPEILDKYNLGDIVGDRVSNLTCESKGGNPFPSIEWYLNDENITQNASSFVRDGIVVSSLIYTFQKKNNGSTLSCFSVHQMGNQNSSRTLNVLYKPIVSVAQKMYTVNDGTDLEIDCQVDSNPPSVPLWKPSFNVDTNHYSFSGNKLILRKINPSMDGVDFQCSSQNSIGRSEPESIKLNVLYQPKIAVSNKTVNKVQLGSPFRLDCKFTGNPKPIVRWNFVDSINTAEHTPETSSENPGQLFIKNISYADEGDYYCEGSNFNSILNTENIVRSNKFAVNVVGKPQFLNKLDVVTGYKGSETYIVQTFCSDPIPTEIQWEYAGSTQHNVEINVKDVKDSIFPDLQESDAHIIPSLLEPLGLKSTSPTCFKASLLIRNTDIADARDYTLRVRNAESVIEGIISLEVTSKLSGAMVISISLILLIMLFLLTVLFILFVRRRASKREEDSEDKSDVRVPINDSSDAAKQSDEKVL